MLRAVRMRRRSRPARTCGIRFEAPTTTAADPVVPSAGDSFIVAPDDRTARQIADKREAAERAALLAKRRKRVSLENLTDVLKKGKVTHSRIFAQGTRLPRGAQR